MKREDSVVKTPLVMLIAAFLFPAMSGAQDCDKLVRSYLARPHLSAEIRFWDISDKVALTQEEGEKILETLKLLHKPYNLNNDEKSCLERKSAAISEASIRQILGDERSRKVDVEAIERSESAVLLQVEGVAASAAEKLKLSAMQKSQLVNVLNEARLSEPFWKEDSLEHASAGLPRLNDLKGIAEFHNALEKRRRDYQKRRTTWVSEQMRGYLNAQQLRALEQILANPSVPDSAREFASLLGYEQSMAHLKDVLKLSKEQERGLLQLFQSIGQELDQMVYAEIRPKLARGEPGDLGVPLLKRMGERQTELLIERADEVLSGDMYNRFTELLLQRKISVPYVSGVQELAAKDGYTE